MMLSRSRPGSSSRHKSCPRKYRIVKDEKSPKATPYHQGMECSSEQLQNGSLSASTRRIKKIRESNSTWWASLRDAHIGTS